MSKELEHKSLGAFEIKDAEKGIVESVIATLNVVDKDEDIIVPSAIAKGAKVSMSSYGHDAVYGTRPVGKGTLNVEGDQLIFRGKMFLTTQAGRETFEVLKEMGSDQEWSFGFRILGAEVPDEAQRKEGARRVLTKLDAFEVSPVIIGAGVGTRTLAVKEAEQIPLIDPGVEAARVEAERAAEAAAKAVAKLNNDVDRMFKQPPPGVR